MKRSNQKETNPELAAPQDRTDSPLVRIDGDSRLIKKGTSKECFYFQVARKLIGDKWSLLILFILKDGTMRFNALLRGVEGISQKVLAGTLRGLDRDGYIKREVINGSPPRVEYSLTTIGRDFLHMLTTVSAWVERNWQAMETNRQDFDRSAETCKSGPVIHVQTTLRNPQSTGSAWA